MYPRFFMKFLQILHGQLSGVHCLILCLKIFRLSEFFISFGKFRHRTAPIVVIVSKFLNGLNFCNITFVCFLCPILYTWNIFVTFISLYFFFPEFLSICIIKCLYFIETEGIE